MSDASGGPGTYSTVEYAEAAEKPHDTAALYIPLVDERGGRYLEVVTHVDARPYHIGWQRAAPATARVMDVTVDEDGPGANPPMVKE